MPQHPNILYITADQLRADALGCYGNAVIRTPNVDALAARGVRLTRMFAAYPVCAPNRGSIVTGRYPTIHRLRANGMRLPADELTLMEVLRQSGYRTYGAGKMHFGPQWRFPADGSPIVDPDPATAFNPQPAPDQFPWYGFEQAMLSEDHRTGPYADYLAEHGFNVWDELHSASFPQHATVRSPFPEAHHQTTWITERGLDYLRAHPVEEPFFLWVSYVHPHHPFNPPAPYDSMYLPDDMPLPIWDPQEVEGWPEAYRQKYFATGDGHEAVGLDQLADADWQRIKAFYYGMVSQIDKNIGRLIERLRSTGQLDNTLVIFNADHGEMLGDHHLLFKGTTYDCVTNVPFIAAGPGVPSSGDARALLCSSIDIMPTLLDLAGVAAPAPSPVQGRSLARALDDPTTSLRDALLIENAGIRRSIRTPNALLTWHGAHTQGELYCLDDDPNCLINLWGQPAAAQLQAELTDQLIQLLAENVDPLPPREGPW